MDDNATQMWKKLTPRRLTAHDFCQGTMVSLTRG